MRIIAGKYRGRRLAVPAGRCVRPTGDRMKESIFSALGQACSRATVLDLFAGSGALGLEALSRGAAGATFVDKGRGAIGVLKKNIMALSAESLCRVVQAEVFSFLGNLEQASSFDLVFADPPFEGDSAQLILSRWLEGRLGRSTLILEYPTKSPPEVPGQAVPAAKTGHFGESSYSIYLPDEH
ncbi:MAG: 16S rRNA (guanine(966)-N(2))-methyltransferase RsmD [Candidatus Glassbacteria bacterium]|nr:16S rRNA (guanine(966)-N(2))-methyltransferase RsmD [Candidatus Glassbacteria bacterium]